MVFAEERDPSAEYLMVRVVGGEQPGATFSQRVGPLRIAGKVVGEEIKNLTAKEYKLQKVHVLLKVKDKKTTTQIAPTTAQIIIRELKEVREPKKKGAVKTPGLHNGSLSMKSLFKVATEIRSRSRSHSMKGTLKEAAGTAMSVGCSIENRHPKEVVAAINSGRAAVAELFGVDADSLPAFLDE